MKKEVKVVFSTFEEAMEVLNKLFDILKKNKVIMYKDLYKIVGKTEMKIQNERHKILKKEFLDIYKIDQYKKYGWSTLFYAKIESYGSEWILKLPDFKLIIKENK